MHLHIYIQYISKIYAVNKINTIEINLIELQVDGSNTCRL